jgi:hypothetical protein
MTPFDSQTKNGSKPIKKKTYFPIADTLTSNQFSKVCN